jgi:hypothetical protein
MDLKQEMIRNVRSSGLKTEDEKSLIQEIEEIWAFEDALDEEDRRKRRGKRDLRRRNRQDQHYRR